MKNTLLLTATLAVLAVGCKSKTDEGIVYDSSAGNQQVTMNQQNEQQATPSQPQPTEAPKHAVGKFGDTTYTASGLGIIDLKPGTGPSPKDGQEVTIMYTGKLTNGQTFDSNEDPAFGHPEPFKYHVGVDHMVQGWEEGVSTMKQGGKRRLIVPGNLGYGPAGSPPKIPGNATLVFDLTLQKVQ